MSDDDLTLARFWMPPTLAKEDDEQSSAGAPVACIASTYTFHATLFENDLLPVFLKSDFDPVERERAFVLDRDERLATGARVFVLVDSGHVSCDQTTLRWHQIPVRVGGGCQHSKVTLLVWEKCIRVIVSSANLTRTGYRHNHEMAGVLDFFDSSDCPPRSVFNEVLAFFRGIVPWLRGPDEITERLLDTLADVERRSRAFRAMPDDNGLRRPQVAFAPTVPAHGRSGLSSSLDRFVDLWGSSRTASTIGVMTPFVGQDAGSMADVIAKLATLRRSRAAEGHLVVPAALSQDDPAKMVVQLPDWFRASWERVWSEGKRSVRTYAVPQRREQDDPVRALHAKALYASDDAVTLLMIGSSNFSPHGMGVKVANIEANLCYTHSSDAEMVSRLPFDPEGDEVEHATWIDEAVLGSEDAPPTAPVVPAVFKWVELRPREGRLVVGLDPNQQLPARWSMTVTLGAIKTRVLDDTRLSSVPDEGCVTVAIGVPVVTSVLVEWEDEKGIQSGHLPILVADPSALPPPEELRALGADGILDCLLSGRSPIEWAETQAERKTRSAGQAHDLDSLRSVDTSEYAVYRLRRFGRALGQLAQRLLGAPRIVDAFQYRLAHDPLGPIALADAIGRDWAKYDPSHASFALAELVLCVSHVGRRIHRERAAGDPDLRTHFNETVRRIAALIASAEGTPKLSKYVRAVKQECGSLLALDLEATNAG